MVVYRNARPGSVSGYATKLTVSPYNMVVPGLTPTPGMQQPGVSWVGSFMWIDNTAVRDRSLAGLTNRTAGSGPSTVGEWDTNGAVTSYSNITTSGNYAGAAAASFELRLYP